MSIKVFFSSFTVATSKAIREFKALTNSLAQTGKGLQTINNNIYGLSEKLLSVCNSFAYLYNNDSKIYERLVYKIKSKGYVSSEDFSSLMEHGIPVYTELENLHGYTKATIGTVLRSKEITWEMIEESLYSFEKNIIK